MRGNDLAEEVIARQPHLSSMQLQKLLYYIDSWHLAVTGNRLITDQPFRAYVYGPVHDDVWHKRRSPASRARAQRAISDLSETAIAIITLVLREYGGRTGDELSALTHTEVPWIKARKGLPPHTPSREPIKDEDVARFFRDHRLLGNRTAADLAAGGVYVADPVVVNEPVDLNSILSSLPPPPEDDDESAFAANLLDPTVLISAGTRRARG